MADTDIETTIYRLELDGSAYVDGVDKVANSTKKLSEVQDAANKKLAELKAQQATYMKQLAEVNAVLKANEKETIELTKRLNELKAAEQGSYKEAKNLENALKANALNTKEFRIEQAALKTNLAATGTAIKVQSAELKAAEVATGGFTKGLTKAYSGLRNLAYLIPGVGIGGLVALIAGPLVSAFSEWAASIDDVNQKQDLLKDALGGDEYKSAIKDVSALTLNIKLAKEGFLDKNEVLKQYNDTLGKSLGAVTDLDKAEDNLVKKGPAYIQMTLFKAAANLALDKAAQQAVDAALALQKSQEKIAEVAKKGETEKDIRAGTAGLTEFLTSGLQNEAIAAKQGADKGVQRLKNIAEDFQKDAAKIAQQFKIDFDPHKQTKPTAQKSIKEITNIYEQELQKLIADIAKINEKGFVSEETITKSVEADFEIRKNALIKAFENKQLTKDQLDKLIGIDPNQIGGKLGELMKLILDQNLKTFDEQRQAYLQAINDEITNLQIEESAKRISTIQDNFERERQTIISETEKTVSALEQKRDQRIAQIIKDAAKNGLKPEDIAPQIQQIKDEYSKLLDDLEIIKNQKLQQLAFETFEALTEDAKRLLTAQNLAISEASLQRIKEQAALFEQGKISFKQYQEALTQIAHDEENKRFEDEKAFLDAEIKRRDEKLFGDENLTPTERKQLQDEIIALRQRLADAEKGDITGNIADPTKVKTDKFIDYANSIKALTDSVISFWQQTNEAEQRALERSIQLQETRVDAAQRIAERGNAQYLKGETDRLNELNVARENAARKQLGIDAALQASQILVGITGAIAKIATPGIGPAETIAEIAVIIGALATGFGLVKSLQGNQPRLFKGTKYLERDGQPAGKDTIPVMANEGEAVIPTETNRKYHPTVAAIYDKTIPAEELNRFVTTYHKIKPVPQVNYERIGEAATFHVERDGKMNLILSEQNKLLKDNNELQGKVLRILSKSGVNVSLDSRGFAVTQMELIEQIKREKKL